VRLVKVENWIYCAFDVEDVGAKCFGSQEANEVVVVILNKVNTRGPIVDCSWS